MTDAINENSVFRINALKDPAKVLALWVQPDTIKGNANKEFAIIRMELLQNNYWPFHTKWLSNILSLINFE